MFCRIFVLSVFRYTGITECWNTGITKKDGDNKFLTFYLLEFVLRHGQSQEEVEDDSREPRGEEGEAEIDNTYQRGIQIEVLSQAAANATDFLVEAFGQFLCHSRIFLIVSIAFLLVQIYGYYWEGRIS